MTKPARPELAINSTTETVADALNGFLTYAATGLVEDTHVAIATAYFNVGGYTCLAESLDHVAGVRLLLGAEPDPRERRVRQLKVESVLPERTEHHRLKRALEGHEHTVTQDRDLLGFSLEADREAQRLVEWLRSGRVQVRRLESGFLHGKAFMVGAKSHGVVAGSSNFTFAGLTKNIELNLGNYTPGVVDQVKDWFDELWNEAVDYDLAALFEARFEAYSPQLIYLRMLWELYGGELEAEREEAGNPKIHLTGFQRDGVWRAQRILDKHGGVLIADEVGLGKTYLAGALIHQAAIEQRQRVLVVAPATLRDGPWRSFKADQNLPFELRSFDDLANDVRLNPKPGAKPKLDSDPKNYAMVVVDEAHNLRNPSTQRAESFRRLLAAGSPAKSLVLLTATPVNNSLWDLYHLLGYFLANDAAFADIGIRSVRDHFAEAMTFNPEELSPKHLFDVLDSVAVRRTRSFVKSSYSNDRIKLGDQMVPIEFPIPRVRKVTYDLDAVMPGFFDRFAKALDIRDGSAAGADPKVLSLARYTPSRYRHDGIHETYEGQLSGLLRSGLLKRFESSPHAFARTCTTMADSNDAFLTLLANGQVATGDELADWSATDSDEIDQADSYRDGHIGLLDVAADYDVDTLTRHVSQDRDLLRDFADEAKKVTRASDPTLAALVDELIEISREAQTEGIGENDTRNKRKVLIFSYFADTVEWITEHLHSAVTTNDQLACYRGRIASITGGGGSDDKHDVLWGFAPKTTDAPHGSDTDRYDIVVTTDVLAEGVNLQQARHIINYDLPWNPMRLVQRHGRIDRIGSYHKKVFIRCVFPDTRLDDLLGLEDRMRRKLKQAAATVGVTSVLPEQTAVDVEFTETRAEIERLRREDNTLFERHGTTRGAISGEEYRQELRQALQDASRGDQISALPWGAGSGMALSQANASNGPGFVFCVHIGDWPRTLFRYVELGLDADPDADPDANPVVIDDTLTCLDHAKPPQGFGTPRVLDDDTQRLAFDAWGHARNEIIKTWNFHADKANLEPQIPPVLRKAADIVRSNPPSDLDQTGIDDLIDTIQAPYPQRTIRSIRAALRATDNPAEQVARLQRVVNELGLEPFIPPEALPEITSDDVHLVCWIALTAEP